jgi:putative protease
MPPQYPKPEIMSPAGYWPQLQAAVDSGADSVYFGLKHFTARAKVGFSLSELPEVMRTLHSHGVRGYVTLNTLVFDHEIREAANAIAAIAEAGADAIIVQDPAVLKLARRIAPGLELHASTQMSIADAHGVRLAQRLGVSRVTLARELSLAEVRAIRSATDCELEIFVHGALCVAYSGQCFSSEAWGGRSANRGQCAQACRLPYEMIVDGEFRPLGDARYLLSPGDLYALHHVPEIVSTGISALKIEGRYKDADYVSLTTRAYRRAVDEAVAARRISVTPKEEIQLEQVYSRGLGAHFIAGTNHQTVVSGRSPRHRGVQMGTVVRVSSDSVVIEPSAANAIAPLKPGDGLVFDAASWRSPQEREEGGRVYQVRTARPGRIELRFANGALDPARIRPGDLVWRTDDPDLQRAVRSAPIYRQPVQVTVRAHTGSTLRAEWKILRGRHASVSVESENVLEPAQHRGLTAETVSEQFGRLGNTAYEIAGIEADIQGKPFVPVSLLNTLRREAVEKLAGLQLRSAPVEVHPPDLVVESELGRIAVRSSAEHGPAELHLLVRTPEQLDAALRLQPASVTLDYLDLYGLGPSVERAKHAGITVRVASPRMFKPGEERVLQFLRKLDCAILVRSAGLLEAMSDTDHPPLIGDFSLNAANSLTADLLLSLGLVRITPTHDLNAAQIAALASEIGGASVEAIAYGHLPVFHTDHCVFCRFLSTGTTYKDCGRPCEHHRVALRDENGRAHPVMADVGCRNTVFGAEAQEASLHLETWRSAGIRHFRLEFVHETAEDVVRVTEAFADALAGRTTTAQLTAKLRRAAPCGTTEGSLFVPANYTVLPILQ